MSHFLTFFLLVFLPVKISSLLPAIVLLSSTNICVVDESCNLYCWSVAGNDAVFGWVCLGHPASCSKRTRLQPLAVLHCCARPGQCDWVPGDFCSPKAPTHHQTALLPMFSYGWLAGWGRQNVKIIFCCLCPAGFDFLSVFLPRLWHWDGRVETVTIFSWFEEQHSFLQQNKNITLNQVI